jgi:transposase
MALNLHTEKDIERLRQVAVMQDGELKRVLRKLVDNQRELAKLRGEDFDQQQFLNLLTQASTARIQPDNPADSPKPKPRKKRKKFGTTPQPALPLETREEELDDADRMCPACGDELAELPGQFETSEMIDVVEVDYRRVQVRQKKYRCRCGGCIETAPPAQRAVKGGRYSLGFGLKVALDKYLYHLPLARQTRILLGRSVTVGRNTLWDQLDSLADELQPVAEAIIDAILAQPVIGLDQTGWPNLEKGRKHKKWQMWCLTAPGLVAHLIRDDKSKATFDEVVRGFEGTIACDMMSTHIAAARAGPGIQLAACWAHVRRKFAEAEADFPMARMALKMIRELYDIDAAAEGPEQLAELRRTRSREVLKRLHAWLSETVLPKSTNLGNAVRYALGHWQELTRFADDPAVPLDNNATERALRGPVVGRRNHFGSKSRRGTQVAAVFYTLLESAKLAGVNERDYLRAAIVARRQGLTLLPADCVDNAA